MTVDRTKEIEKSLPRIMRLGLPKASTKHLKYWCPLLSYCTEPGFYLSDSPTMYRVSLHLSVGVKKHKELDSLMRKWFCYNFVTVDKDDKMFICYAKLMDAAILKKEFDKSKHPVFGEKWAEHRFECIRSMIEDHLKDRHKKLLENTAVSGATLL